MRGYLRFLVAGLILGLFTEAEMKLVAGINPSAFPITVVAYPIFITIFYGISRLLDRMLSSVWIGDTLHFALAGIFGLAVEWTLLGNGPGSNALQLGMFVMWTAFSFGPRVLTRASTPTASRRRFWIAFAVVAVLITAITLATPDAQAKLLIAVFGLSAINAVWSFWFLLMAWNTRRISASHEQSMA